MTKKKTSKKSTKKAQTKSLPKESIEKKPKKKSLKVVKVEKLSSPSGSVEKLSSPPDSVEKLHSPPDSEVILEEKPLQNLPSVSATSSALSVQDPLVAYLNEIRKYPLLSPEEEHELALKYHNTGDKLAAEKLVTSNLRFVVKVAAEYSRFGAKMIDLIQEGNVGLMHAVKEFNPYKGVRLITYAVWWIKGYIREYLMRQHSMVRIGTSQNQKKLFYNLQKEARKLESLGEEAAIEVLSKRLGVPEDDIREMKQRLEGKDVSLDQPSDESLSLLSKQKDLNSLSPEEKLILEEQENLLRAKVDEIAPELNEKELFILENRMLADEPLTLQEIGDRFKITRERARQLEERVMKKLRDKLSAS